MKKAEAGRRERKKKRKEEGEERKREGGRKDINQTKQVQQSLEFLVLHAGDRLCRLQKRTFSGDD